MSAAIAEPVVEHERTDLGNSIHFADEHKSLIRYDHLKQRWLIWNEHYWKPDYGPLLAQKIMDFVQREYFRATAEEASIGITRERRKTIHWGNASSARACAPSPISPRTCRCSPTMAAAGTRSHTCSGSPTAWWI